MIRKSENRNIDQKNNLFNGKGEVKIRHLLNNSEEMYNKGRVFAHSSLEPGHSIGYHVHNNESETYYILNGTAEFNDNGKIVTLEAGDVTFTGDNEGHGIKNIGEDVLNFIALILYK
jgi:mannose-6-phosphate isomerase-like protein (cupin superfamily)